ncbi:MAG: hypothetical protein Fur0021_15370 [Candidatus Promineifilaceae bacterium]
MSANETEKALAQALWRLYYRPERPQLWQGGGNLPWNDPAFSQRMLREHLDESHGAASRVAAERAQQIDWLWRRLALEPGQRVLDMTCGPGLYAVELARRGCQVVGVDFGPAAIAHAIAWAQSNGVADRCHFVEQDVTVWQSDGELYDAALFLYGQLAVFPRDQAQRLLQTISQALRPGGKLCVELLDQDKVDKQRGSWWFTDEQGLWGSAPFLHLGERFWDEASRASMERFQILHLETGQLDEIILCDQTYAVTEMEQMMQQAGFATVNVYPAWDGLLLYDAEEWNVYVAQK